MALSLSKETVTSIIEKFNKFLTVKFPLFVETGTNLGGTIFAVEDVFEKLYTIELKEEFYLHCKNQYKGEKIKFLQGDSSKVLPELIKWIDNNVVFYLDAHWSALNTAHGDKEVPLLEELEVINSIKHHIIIIIDDYRLFGVNIRDCNWSDITEHNILSKIDKNRIIDWFVTNDRYVLFLHSKVD